MSELDTQDIAAKIQRRRRALQWTQKQLAEEVGCTIDAVQAWETGRRRPSTQFIVELSKALKLRIPELLPRVP